MKRILDIVVAILGLLVLSPVLLALVVLVRLNVGKGVFFRQLRPGLAGRPFRLTKFRSMNEAVDADGCLKSDADRLGRFGRWLRATSLDELPELWNVLRGDMSLVGPRPLLMEYLPLYSPTEARRHEVRPGLTGWAQIHGRNATTWDQRFEFDVWYVDHQSLWLDVKILWRTFWIVITRRGVSQDGHATMLKFQGKHEG